MRISTSQLYDAPSARMSALTIQSDKLQAQISTGNRINSTADDPAGWRQLATLDRADADDKSFSDNVKLVQGLLSQTDSALGSAQTQVQRARELALQAANGATSPSDRQAISAEFNTIVDELYALANSTDTRGQPLFGGADGATPFARASDGTISYQGSGEPSAIPIGVNASVSPGVTGDRAFGDLFATLKTIGDAIAAGNPPPDGSVDALNTAGDTLSGAQASVGARSIRTDLEADRLTNAGVARDDVRTAIDGVDVSATITQLQKTLTILQATQASFTKLSGLSLFDYLK